MGAHPSGDRRGWHRPALAARTRPPASRQSRRRPRPRASIGSTLGGESRRCLAARRPLLPPRTRSDPSCAPVRSCRPLPRQRSAGPFGRLSACLFIIGPLQLEMSWPRLAIPASRGAEPGRTRLPSQTLVPTEGKPTCARTIDQRPDDGAARPPRPTPARIEDTVNARVLLRPGRRLATA
jgi:hypothetical protein